MKRTLRGVVTIVALLAMPVLAAPAADKASDEATLRRLKEVLWPRAYAEQDVPLLDSILAEEFRLVDADGNWTTKSEELADVKKNKPSYDSLVFAIKRLEIFENGTAIVAGEGTVKGRDKDGPYVVTYQSTNVLIKRGEAWKAIASHVSGIKREAGQSTGAVLEAVPAQGNQSANATAG